MVLFVDLYSGDATGCASRAGWTVAGSHIPKRHVRIGACEQANALSVFRCAFNKRYGNLVRINHILDGKVQRCRRIKTSGTNDKGVADPLVSSEDDSGVQKNEEKSTNASKVSSFGNIVSQYEVPDVNMAKQLGIEKEFFESIMELPGTTNVRSLKSRLLSLAQWNSKLSKGTLPKADDLTWPEEPFRSKFLDVLRKLGMARFTQKHPKLLGSLLRQFLQLAKEFEVELMNNEQEQSRSPENSPSSQNPETNNQQQNQNEGQTGESPSQGNEAAEGEPESSEESGAGTISKEASKSELEVELEDINDDGSASAPGDAGKDDTSGFAEDLVENMLQKFEDQWAPAMEALETAQEAFDDIEPLLEGPEGFDASAAVWHNTGWTQLQSLRKKLENLKELRDLVRSLGRGGGKGPIRRAPQQIYKSGMPLGVIRSEESPEETRGLTRSGDISRMLPSEARLLASGWPKGDISKGSKACRRLFLARRAERTLLSYERAGWVDDQPSRVTGRLELRPASEMGPIIVCLDTSASMLGPRETVAKSLTLECMRGAIRQQRKCLVYAFSGPENVMELELDVGPESISKLLSFLTMSFSGGTDVDAPLALSLERLGREEWNLADILMVTDGEIPHPNEDILGKLNVAKDDMGLSVHGLLVGRVTEPMQKICTDIHVFKSWNVVDESWKS